jgi:hypothetical protein
MTQVLTKEEVERRIFEALAPLVGADVVPGSIRRDKPPAPDIECQTKADGPWAVELVALDAQHTRTRLRNMAATNQAWDRAISKRPVAEQAQLRTRSADLHLSVNLSESAGTRDRAAIMTLIQDRLLTLPAGFAGEIFNVLNAPADVHYAAASRSQVEKGPHITTSSVGSWLPPQLDKIQEKLVAKTYRTDAPLDLFAYSEHDEVDGHVNGRAEIEQCIKTYLPGSRFRRVAPQRKQQPLRRGSRRRGFHDTGHQTRLERRPLSPAAVLLSRDVRAPRR